MDRKLDNSLQILPTCNSPCLKFSEETVNTWWCHLSEAGVLVNQNSPKEVHDGKTNIYSKYTPDVADVTEQRSLSYGARSQSPFTLNSHLGLSTNGKGLSPFSDGSTALSKRRKGYDVHNLKSPDSSSGYQSPFVTSRRPPRLRIYPGALGSSGLRGLGQRYWEAEVTCDVKVHLYGLPISEAGVAWAEAADTTGLVEGVGNSWVMRLTTCYEHTEHVCAKAVHGCRPLYHSPVRPCVKNDKFVLKYGFLLNFDTKELAIIDISKGEVFYVFENVNTSRDLWPVFGVFSRHRHHVQVRLLAGKDLILGSTVSGLISELINRTPGKSPVRVVSPKSLKFSMFMQAT